MRGRDVRVSSAVQRRKIRYLYRKVQLSLQLLLSPQRTP
jgi:hypothetical protein